MLVLDSSLDELSGPQGQWLTQKLDHLPGDVDFVFVVLHHPPYTSSSDMKIFGGGHSARSQEQELAKMLEARQQNLRARIVVFSGHVHNYERHEHGGVTYFVTGGAGAHAYPIERAKDDPFQSKEVNYHYLHGGSRSRQSEDHHAPSRPDERHSRLDATRLGRDLGAGSEGRGAKP